MSRNPQFENSRWLIWCFERNMFWRSGSNGYTENIDEAGFYSFEEAYAIVNNANKYATSVNKPEEAMLPYYKQS